MPYPRPVRFLLLVCAALCLAAAPLRAQDPTARGVGLLRRGDYVGAQRALEPYVRSHPSDARAAFYLGWAFLRQRQVDPAVEWLERAVELDGRNAEYRLQLGNAYGLKAAGANPIRRAILARSARQEYDQAVALAPDNIEARWGLMRFYMLAPGLLGGDPAKAREQAAEIRKRNPYRATFAMVYIHGQENDPAAAAREFERAIRVYPDSSWLYFQLGLALDAQKRYTEEFAVYERLLRRRPGNMGAEYQIGRTGAVSGLRLERAEQALLLYLRYTPRRGEPPHWATRWRLGMVYERQGKRERARAEYRTAVALNPAAREPREALARLGG